MFINFSQGFGQNLKIVAQNGNQIVKNIEVPFIMAYSVFQDFVLQTAKDNRPWKITCTKDEFINENGKQMVSSLEFMNNTWVREFEKDDM